MRPVPRIGLVAAAALIAGCGVGYDLPTETPQRSIPSDGSYQMLATWSGMTDVADILLTQGTGSQLVILFNHGGTDSTSRGEVRGYPLTRPDPLPSVTFGGLFRLYNPVALCSGGDGVTVPSNNRIYVLDQGDTTLAHMQLSPTDTVRRVTRLEFYWRVREYRLLGGDTLTSFTDLRLAFVRGIAADAEGRVYVSGVATVNVPSQIDPNVTERVFQDRIYRYERGSQNDPMMPGANWHRDPNWQVEQGSGVGTLQDQRGIFWSGAGNGSLLAADYGKNWAQRLSTVQSSSGDLYLDGGQTGTPFNGPQDVSGDLQGFIYVADTGNQRVLRYSAEGAFVQRVDVEPNAFGSPLLSPVALAADDSLVYVADRGQGQVIRYKRRP